MDRARGELFHELVVGALDLGVGLDERLKPFFAFESFGTGVSPALSALTLLPRLPWPVWSGRCPVRYCLVRALVGLDMRRNLRYFTRKVSVALESFGILRDT